MCRWRGQPSVCTASLHGSAALAVCRAPSALRFVFKKAHLSREDFRVFDYDSGHPVAVMHHFNKNPYGGTVWKCQDSAAAAVSAARLLQSCLGRCHVRRQVPCHLSARSPPVTHPKT